MSCHNKLTQCRIDKIYLKSESTIELYLPKLNCTDMSGTIKLCKNLCSEVCTIIVYVEDFIDIVYYKPNDKLNTKWKAKRAIKNNLKVDYEDI